MSQVIGLRSGSEKSHRMHPETGVSYGDWARKDYMPKWFSQLVIGKKE